MEGGVDGSMIVSVTPAYNEEKHIAEVVKAVKKYVDKVIVVDDYSKDNTLNVATEAGADVVIRNPENSGQGYSLRMGIKKALEFNPDVIVTVDADMQHDPAFIPILIKPILDNKNIDMVLGSRIKDSKNMPLLKKVGNFGLNLLTRILFGIYTTDSQSGFRAYSQRAARELKFWVHRYGWASILFAELSEFHLNYAEVDVPCIYHDPKKGTTMWDGIKIGLQMINYKRLYFQRRLLKWIGKR